jgi:leucine dehydrogenase
MTMLSVNDLDSSRTIGKLDKLLSHSCLQNANELYIKVEPEVGLIAVVALSQSNFNHGLGGTRCLSYLSLNEAMADAIKLANTMGNKMRFAGLPFSGAKAVLIKPETLINREQYFAAYGRFIESLQGRIITGCDSGVSQADMQLVAKYTQYITGLPEAGSSQQDDLAYLTALGIKEAMRAALQVKLAKTDLKGIKIAVQGLGKVGYCLVKMLYEQGAELVVTDIDADKIKQLCQSYPVAVALPDEIHQVQSDIFAPCGLGGTVTPQMLDQVAATIICGAANNPLATFELDEVMVQKNILYVPDFIANVGGAVYAAFQYQGRTSADAQVWLQTQFYQETRKVLDYALTNNLPTDKAARLILSGITSSSKTNELDDVYA